MTASETGGTGERTGRPPLRLVRGDATPEEIAALVAVLSAVGGEGEDRSGERGRRRSSWAAPESRIRPAVAHGPGAWRGSALPH